ncbi:Homeobox protein PKNOX1 [Choanephora cucurbitarum]|uniref:Homeobox protein PKNOX1 n=1 Tax=Choanephora cucurbitarum TaxID=101091 RepID=A0A1C7N5E9_9FUNG|nr:Homeobox protein PKNOX1 [Choanephora cucurbitarum]
MSTTLHTEKKIRTFSPIILFHDYEYVKAGSGDLEHVHIPYGDPSYGRHLDVHKKRIQEMLETNGRYWLFTWTRDHPESLDHSPVPSLVSSPSPPHHYPTLLPPTHYHYYEHASMKDNRHKHIHQSTMKIHHEKKSANVSIISNKRRRGNLPKAVTAILRDWLSRHKKHPYPTEEEKATLAAETNLNLNQISNWFINARRRILQPMLEQEEEEEHAHLDTGMPVSHEFDMMYDDKHNSFGQ